MNQLPGGNGVGERQLGQKTNNRSVRRSAPFLESLVERKWQAGLLTRSLSSRLLACGNGILRRHLLWNIQQRDCSGFTPDSLLGVVVTHAPATRMFAFRLRKIPKDAAKLLFFFELCKSYATFFVKKVKKVVIPVRRSLKKVIF